MLRYLPDSYYKHLTGLDPITPRDAVETAIKRRLEPFGLADLEDKNEVVPLPIPTDFGTIDQELALAYAAYDGNWEAIESLVQATAPDFPSQFHCPVGWSYWNPPTRAWVAVTEPPSGRCFVLDAETVEVSENVWHPTCMVAMSVKGWLVWRAGLSCIYNVSTVPFGVDNTVIGYNVCYDRSYLGREHKYARSGNRFFDLMSCWIVTNGMSSQQKPVYNKFADAEDDFTKPVWLQKTATNGLAAAYFYYTQRELDKGVRDEIVNQGLDWVSGHMPEVIRYCAMDVLATHELSKYLFPAYCKARPSKTNRYGAIALGSCWLPMAKDRWPDFYSKVESSYQSSKADLSQQLAKAAEVSMALGQTEQTAALDWTPAKTGKNKGLPKWFRDILAKSKSSGLSLSQRWAPLVLGLHWDGEPVHWDDEAKGFYTGKHGLIPHPAQRGQAVGNMFLKDFADLHEAGQIGSPDFVKPLVELKTRYINWVSCRKRIQATRTASPDGYPVNLPLLAPNGTVTGRATGDCQVLANPKVTRAGTEWKSMIAPYPGYAFVGADVASQELWLAACHGDEDLGVCGSTPLSAMAIAGDSKDKTDMHSLVAKETGFTRSATKTRVYGCVPLDAKALTKGGWRSYEELEIGDLILGYNLETDMNEWTPIQRLWFYEQAELVECSNGHNYSHISTPNHRWVTKQRLRSDRSKQILTWRTTDTLAKESNIVTSAYSVGGDSPVTPEEAAIIAWLITDGSVFWSPISNGLSTAGGRKRGVSARIVQKKQPQVDMLKVLLAPCLTKVSFRETSECYVFNINSQFVRDLWTKAGLTPDAENYVELVTSLSVLARRAFLDAFFLAEGHTTKKGGKIITQNGGSELEAAIVAANLEGYNTRLYWKDSRKKCMGLTLRERRHVTGQRLKRKAAPSADVWCPTTSLGTWVMRQGDTVTITGNSLYGQGVKGDSDLVLRTYPTWSESEALAASKKFVSLFKGVRAGYDSPYRNGLASAAFTKMEKLASVRFPETPLTGAKMSGSLAGLDDYKPTRVNWIVQASGVDFRDMLVLLTESFYKRLGVDGRLCLTIHDEIRTMVHETQTDLAAYALQLAHLYVRAAFVRAHGLNNIPAGVAWFTEVDVDTVCLRKDPTDPQVTPTQEALPLGYTLTPKALLERIWTDWLTPNRTKSD